MWGDLLHLARSWNEFSWRLLLKGWNQHSSTWAFVCVLAARDDIIILLRWCNYTADLSTWCHDIVLFSALFLEWLYIYTYIGSSPMDLIMRSFDVCNLVSTSCWKKHSRCHWFVIPCHCNAEYRHTTSKFNNLTKISLGAYHVWWNNSWIPFY